MVITFPYIGTFEPYHVYALSLSGAAMGVKRGSVMMLVRPHESYQDLYDQVQGELKGMEIPQDVD